MPDTTKPKEPWDGGCSKAFFAAALKLLAEMYGPRKMDTGTDELKRLVGPLGGVEYDYRMLDKPDPANPVKVPEKVAGFESKQHW